MKTLVELESVLNALTTSKLRIKQELAKFENPIGNDAANYVLRLRDELRTVERGWRQANTELNAARKVKSHERRKD